MADSANRKGRPEIGGLIPAIRLGALLPRVDHHARQNGVTRPDMIRRLLAEALDRRDRHNP